MDEVGKEVDVRPLSTDEVLSMLPTMELEEWSSTRQELDIMLSCVPGAFHGAVHKRTKKVLSLILVAPLNSDFAYLTYFITHPDFRNKGLGKKVYESAIAAVGDRSIILDAVTPDSVTIYKKWGFHETSTVLDTYHGVINIEILMDITSDIDKNVKIMDRTSDIATDMLEYDFKTGRRYREIFLDASSQSEKFSCKCAVLDGQIVGFGILQPYDSTWWKIPMLYADNRQIAALLLKQILMEIPKDQPSIIIGIINGSEGPRKLFQSVGMQFFKREFRMVSKQEMEVDYSRIWAYNNLLHEPY